MITYTTKFPVNEDFDKHTFVSTVIEWNQGSKFNKIDNLIWNEENYDCKWEQNKTTLAIQTLDEEGIIASRFKKEDDSGIWFTDFVLDTQNKMLSVSVAHETTDFTTDFYPTYLPTYFVKLVIRKGYAGYDNALLVSDKKHNISEYPDIYKGIVNKSINIKLPIVYVKTTASEENPVNTDNLAQKLQGVAHVICDSDNVCQSADTCDTSENDDEASSQIIIYFPSRYKNNKIINIGGQCQDAELLEDRIVNDVYDYMNSRMRKMIDTWDGVYTEKLNCDNRKALSRLSSVEKENYDLYDLFGEQLEKTTKNNEELSCEVQRLTAELQNLRMKYSDKSNKPVIYMGTEKEFYTDEIKEIILDSLNEYQKNCNEKSRRKHIIADLLSSNDFKGIPKKRKEQVKNALRGYRTLNSSLKSLLQTLGFEITEDGKHYKWTYYGDHRYVITAAKTSSDGHAGSNLSSEIGNLLF